MLLNWTRKLHSTMGRVWYLIGPVYCIIQWDVYGT